MSRFAVTDLPLAGLKLVERKRLGDSRGYLARLFCAEELAAANWLKPIAQINHSYTSKRGTVRGMHFQHPPHAEMKLVSCVRGEAYDVAVDVRKNSPTFLHWHGELLTQENHATLLIPEGFAHGFQTLSSDCVMLYFHSVAYQADSEGALNAQDPLLAIKWPMAITEQSARDKSHALIATDFNGITL